MKVLLGVVILVWIGLFTQMIRIYGAIEYQRGRLAVIAERCR